MTTVLVIEDEQPILENILEMLELEGHEVIAAENGAVGVQMAQQHFPDIIICDITMPEMDGYQVLLELRNQPETARIPFIFLTARADKSFVRHGMELGADDYLTKPFTGPELLSAVNARLARHTAITDGAQQNLEQAQKVLTQMVTHELRTPLVAINTALELISRQLGQISMSDLQELLTSLRSGSERLNRMVEQMVLVTQLEAGSLQPETVLAEGLPMRLSELLMAAINLARRFAYRHPDVTIRLDERDIEAVVLCDMHALKHALAELITNALSFSPAGSEVIVSQWQAEGYVWLSISDNGSGIASEELAHVLEDFHQIDRESQDQQGMGLGLPLARRIIEAHGGALEIHSVVDKGTQIEVSLPVADRSSIV